MSHTSNSYAHAFVGRTKLGHRLGVPEGVGALVSRHVDGLALAQLPHPLGNQLSNCVRVNGAVLVLAIGCV